MVLKKLKEIPNATIVQAEPLTAFVGSLFAAAGMPSPEAVEAAAVLVDADLNGIDSHGVGYNLDLHYLGGLMSGYINATPDIRITHETPSTAVVDADRGMGLLAGIFAMNVAIEKARETGTASVAVPNSSHYGAAGYYARMALEHDMIGMTVSSGGRRVIIPMGGREPWMGTNPFSMAAPADKEPPFVIDMASSVTSFGKVSIAAHLGIKIPEGWAVTEDGQPITDPANSPPAYGQPPLGETHEHGAQKGYGIGMMADILGAILPGEPVSGLLPDNPRGGRFCHYFQAIRIDAFRPADEFKANMDEMLIALRNEPTAEGYDRVMYPGQPEHEAYQERTISGIALPEHTIAYFKQMAAELDVPYTLPG
ncbi:MAG: Ldh family oxidoreductase [Chloroflexi bacterium]|nr:Ldh family oxidoreductase [Chloroflexota bacterium]MCH8223459.1 Ldh family oxidoreductase [Chloroflexota bacterium]